MATRVCLARFRKGRAALFGAVWLALLAWLIVFGASRYNTATAISGAGFAFYWWLLALVGGLYLAWFAALLLLNIMFLSGEAVYVSGNRLVHGWPIVFSIGLGDVVEVDVDDTRTPFG